MVGAKRIGYYYYYIIKTVVMLNADDDSDAEVLKLGHADSTALMTHLSNRVWFCLLLSMRNLNTGSAKSSDSATSFKFCYSSLQLQLERGVRSDAA
jgi:hypothetical protein